MLFLHIGDEDRFEEILLGTRPVSEGELDIIIDPALQFYKKQEQETPHFKEAILECIPNAPLELRIIVKKYIVLVTLSNTALDPIPFTKPRLITFQNLLRNTVDAIDYTVPEFIEKCTHLLKMS